MREDRKIIRLVNRHPAAPAQEFTNFVYRLRHIFMRGRFYADPVLLLFGVKFAECAERKQHDVVIRILASRECALAFRGHSDDREQLSVNVNFLSESIFIPEQLFVGIRSQNDHWRMMQVVDFVKPASGRNFEIKDVLPVTRITFQNRVLRLAISIFHYIGPGSKRRILIAQAGGYGFYVR